MTVTVALELLLSLLGQTQQISLLIARLNSEGRTELTEEEWAEIIYLNDAARGRLARLIAERIP